MAKALERPTWALRASRLIFPRAALRACLALRVWKSQRLRLLAGLELPDEGKIFIDGKDVTTSAASDRNLSMVFQSYALFPHLSVAENVVFGLKVRRVPKQERQKKLHRALEITGLLGYEDRKPGELSGGQRQRVALGPRNCCGATSVSDGRTAVEP